MWHSNPMNNCHIYQPCTTSQSGYCYDREQLLAIRDLTGQAPHIDSSLMTNIRHLGINSITPTRRGCRGGKRKHRHSNVNTRNRGVCHRNLIYIDTYQPTCNPNQQVNCLLLNARSVCNKAMTISEHILDKNADILFLTETWLHDDDSPIIEELTPLDYRYLGTCRKHKRGGGTGVVFKSHLKFKTNSPVQAFNTFEHTDLIMSQSDHLRVVVVYRPPSSQISMFLDDFETFINELTLFTGRLIIVGDFNIHIENTLSSDTMRFLELLNIAGFTQLVKDPTHIKNHMLDLVIVREDDTHHWSVPSVLSSLISDHHSVLFSYFTKPTELDSKLPLTQHRNFKTLDTRAFTNDLISQFSTEPINSVFPDAILHDYNH